MYKLNSQYENAKNNIELEVNDIIKTADVIFSRDEIKKKLNNSIIYDVEIIQRLNDAQIQSIHDNNNESFDDGISEIELIKENINTYENKLNDVSSEHLTIKQQFNEIHTTYKVFFWNSIIILFMILTLLYYVRFILF
jgi:hypothetical protein